jgi:C4-dicarboxylate transporter DctQ subunit
VNFNTFFSSEHIGRMTDRIDRMENAVLVWTILGLALVGFVQVFSRYLFNYSFTWYEELGRYLGVFVAFLGASIGVKRGSHFTMDLLVSHLVKPWQQLLRFCTCALSGGFFFLVTFYSWKIVIRMHGYGTTSPTMEIPMYLAYLPIPFFSFIMGLRFFRVGIQELLSLRSAPASRKGNPAS